MSISHQAGKEITGEKFDAVIIGAGLGGLICGAFLAKAGQKVAILEQHSVVGGSVTSYSRDGFSFDVVQALSGLAPGEPIDRIFSALGVYRKLTFASTKKAFKFVYPDATVDCWVDQSRYQAELVRVFPHEAAGIGRYFQAIKKIWAEICASYYQPNLFQYLSYPFRFPSLFRHQNETYREFLGHFVSDEKLQEVMGSGWLYLGLDSSRVSAIYMIAMYLSYHLGGTWFPQGGYQGLSNALAEIFCELGGTLRLNARVGKILVESRRAYGVELENGEHLLGTRVVSNSDSKQTFLNLVGASALPARFVRQVQGLQVSVSGISVHLGVDMRISPELACGYLVKFPSYGSSQKSFALAGKNQMEEAYQDIAFGLTVPTFMDPTRAPAGQHTVELIWLPAPYAYQNHWEKQDVRQYERFKGQMADKLIQAAESLIPGLAEHIVVKDVITPLTLERYTSATEGAWYDAACLPEQSLLKRLRVRTPVENLFLTGAKTFPGPGMFGAICGGLFTADLILGHTLTGGKFLLRETR
jgi:prolycopene isomerase